MVEADKKKNTVLDVLRSQKGFSLSELLVTLVLVGLITAVIAGGIGMVARSYTKVVDRSDAEQLMSTVVSRITDELSFAMPYDANKVVNEPDTKTVDFVSGLTGMRVRITAGADSLQMFYYSNKDNPEERKTVIPLVDSKLKERMTINYSSIKYDEAKGLFTIEGLEVTSKNNSVAPVKVKSYTVARINSQAQS